MSGYGHQEVILVPFQESLIVVVAVAVAVVGRRCFLCLSLRTYRRFEFHSGGNRVPKEKVHKRINPVPVITQDSVEAGAVFN